METTSDSEAVPSSRSKLNGSHHLRVFDGKHFVCEAHDELRKSMDAARDDIRDSRRSSKRWLATLTLLVPLVAAFLAGFFQLRTAALANMPAQRSDEMKEIIRELHDMRVEIKK